MFISRTGKEPHPYARPTNSLTPSPSGNPTLFTSVSMTPSPSRKRYYIGFHTDDEHLWRNVPSHLLKVVYSAQNEPPVVYAFKAGGSILHIDLVQGTELLFPQRLPHAALPWGVQPYRANTTHRIGVDANLLGPCLSSAQPLVASAVTESLKRGQPVATCQLPLA